ncbi:family 20 glycosylhydrolase [Xanthomonas translucens pv. undulosa]|uniref:family 20 glycosylhydrolase n=1 Tax=Xanthomonas campestris pv. translucens TaxID=343 RepID=UPI00288C4F71|nr:family 20 glycosylhydrolase [Xanthomonas translucens]WNJ31769.1 family 20 glycosylhydrolase [Xanthomonas translucens pv. undulosa]
MIAAGARQRTPHRPTTAPPGAAAASRSTRLGLALFALVAVLSGCNRDAPAAADTAKPAPAPAPAPAAAKPENTAPLPLIPAPAQVKRGSATLTIGTGSTLSVPTDDEAAMRVARQLAALLESTRGLALEVRAETIPANGAIRLQMNPNAPVEAPEGYGLDVDGSTMLIQARDERGLFYGAMSAWQLLTPDAGKGEVDVPEVKIRDWPRFGWRGLLLDVARHFHGPDTVKHVIDAMAEHKLNVLHLHLTDDQGWRIEIKRYPKLTEIGAWRTPPGAGTQGVPDRYGGFYTQDQIRDLVAYAAARHITIVPELDMPGHAQAAVAAYPELVGVTKQRPKVSVDWGVNPYLFNTDAKSMTFIQGVLDEVLQLFPSQYIHIGGDEAVKDQWERSPAVRAQMRKLGVKDAHAMQGWFNQQLSDYLSKHERRLIGWDEILEGGLPASASVMSWRGVDGAVAAAKQGHDVVLAPAGWLYLDNLQSARNDEPNGRLAVLPLQKVYEFDPVPAALSAEEAKHVLGAQAALWAEYIPSAWHIDHALFPRLSALAEAAWSPMDVRGWDGFLQRLPAQLTRYRTLGIDYGDGAFAPDIAIQGGDNAALDSGKASIALGNQARFGSFRYTIDGSEPKADSPRYAKPFDVTLPVTVRAATFADDGSVLAAPRTRILDRPGLLSRDTQGLNSCADGSLGLRVPLLPDLPGKDTPVFNIDLFSGCWRYADARLDGIARIRIDAARLARNYGLAHEQAKVKQYPAKTAHGELEVRLGDCRGKLLARIPLPGGQALGEQFSLEAPLPKQTGTHDLCLRSTARINGPYYAIGAVHLIETTAQAPPAAAR